MPLAIDKLQLMNLAHVGVKEVVPVRDQVTVGGLHTALRGGCVVGRHVPSWPFFHDGEMDIIMNLILDAGRHRRLLLYTALESYKPNVDTCDGNDRPVTALREFITNTTTTSASATTPASVPNIP